MPTFSQTHVLRCLDCGKCTSICPVARVNRTYSPRRMVRAQVEGRTGGQGDAIWSCLTCRYCDDRCPQEVPISSSMPHLRREARQAGENPPFTRCGAMESVVAIQSKADIPQDRLGWIPKDVRLDPRSKTLLFVGCLPYFDAFFTEVKPNTVAAAIGAIRILNALGIEPAVLADERCCGHDALWSGDEDTFERLGRMNVEMLKRVEPELLVTVCPECSMTFTRDYRERFGVPGCDIKHISEVIAEDAARLSLAPQSLKVTFQDPCRLGRHMGRYDEPRRALQAVPELELREMPHHRARASCCAGSWMICNQSTKRIQNELLQEAVGTGSEILVTACPKCLIHLRCSQTGDDGGPRIEIRDLAALVADRLVGSAERG